MSVFDISGRICDRFPHVETADDWPMYSFSRPASMFWQALAEVLHDAGWSDDRIRDWLQSKGPRYALDGAMGDSLRELGASWGRILAAKGEI